MNYTIDEFNMYMQAISESEKESLRMNLLLQRMAFHGDQAQMQRLSRTLDSDQGEKT